MIPHLAIVPADPAPAPVPIGPAAAPLDLEQAFHLYSRYVAGVAMRLCGRSDEVDDIVQDVFLAAARGLRQLREPQAVKGWLATVTVRVTRRRLRLRRLWHVCGGSTPESYEQIAAPGASPEDQAVLARVYTILDGLRAADRIAWTLRYVEGERLERVALLCGCSLATAKRRIAAAQATIEQAMGDE
jgi:RNA polymerase sigma-70 factor (ECF subfamily)